MNEHEITWEEYEEAIVKYLRSDFPKPDFIIKHNIKIRGLKSEYLRQFDGIIYHNEEIVGIIESKCWKANVGVPVIDLLFGMIDDIGKSECAVFIFSTIGFSKPAKKSAKERKYNLIPIHEHFCYLLLHGEINELPMEILTRKAWDSFSEVENLDEFQDNMEFIHYEDWEYMLDNKLYRDPMKRQEFIEKVAHDEAYDEDRRFNCITRLFDQGVFFEDDILNIISKDHNRKLISYLAGYLRDLGYDLDKIKKNLKKNQTLNYL